jgi:hypothetical protein
MRFQTHEKEFAMQHQEKEKCNSLKFLTSDRKLIALAKSTREQRVQPQTVSVRPQREAPAQAQ